MLKFFAIIQKELLQLRRDRARLLLLFLMPAALVIIITLVQENIYKTIGGTRIEGILVDLDQDLLGREIETQLAQNTDIVLTRILSGETASTDAAIAAINQGYAQFAIVLPGGASDKLRQTVKKTAATAFGAPESSSPVADLNLTLLLDPTLSGAFQTAVKNGLDQVLNGLVTRLKIEAIGELLPKKMEDIFEAKAGPYASLMDGDSDIDLKLNWPSDPLLKLDTQPAARGGFSVLPTAAQQTVPAMAVFGMFFIVVPLAGALVRERQSGTAERMMVMPVSGLSLMAGKLTAYTLVCICQFVLILIMGKTLLPLLGIAPLKIGNAPMAVWLTALCVSLAATGYGVLLGTVAKTAEQATTFGPISVVIAAAIGGIMVPIFVMPETMQKIARLSPLEWGHHALLEIFVKNGNLNTIYPQLLLLLAFALTSLLLSWYFFRRNNI